VISIEGFELWVSIDQTLVPQPNEIDLGFTSFLGRPLR
jgi:hypothetical protein